MILASAGRLQQRRIGGQRSRDRAQACRQNHRLSGAEGELVLAANKVAASKLDAPLGDGEDVEAAVAGDLYCLDPLDAIEVELVALDQPRAAGLR